MNWAWISILILSLYTTTAWILLAQAPNGERVTAIHLTPGKKPLLLGIAELGQRPGAGAAADKHLRVRLDAKGWWIANVATERRVDAPTATRPTRYLKRWLLSTGDRINLDGVIITVQETTRETLKLRGVAGIATWENGDLHQQTPPFVDCPQEGTAWWLRHLYQHRELRLFTIGGQVPCPRRWHIPNVSVKAAEVLWQNGQFWLAPGNAKTLSFARSGTNFWNDATELEVRLDDPADPTVKLVLGRTHYHPTWNQTTLTLTPISGGDIWLIPQQVAERPIPQDSRVRIIWETINLATGTLKPLQWLYHQWQWILIAITSSLIISVIILHQSIYSMPLRYFNLITIIPSLIFSILTLANFNDKYISPALLLLNVNLAFGLATLLLFITDRIRSTTGLLWTAALGLILFGSLVQTQLGVGGNSDKWLNFAEHHLLVLAFIGWLIIPLILIPASTIEQTIIMLINPNAPKWSKWIKISLPWLAVFILLLQFSFGSEEGLANTQPVEGIKTLSALLIAYGGVKLWARRWGLSQFHHFNPWLSILELTWGIILFLIFAFLLLIAVRDLSPLLLLTLLLIPTLWRIAKHPRQLYSKGTVILRMILSLIVLIIISSLMWIKLYPKDLPHWVFQYDRLMVWAQPAQYTESGYQVHKAINLAAQGINNLSDNPFGWNGNVMSLPVIQNDFIGAFVLNRAGKTGGIILLLFQFLFVIALLTLSRDVERWGNNGNAPRQAAGVFLSLSLFAFAWLFLTHSVIAWGNVLGLLPVMGQPMTFIAAGVSHSLLFAMPVLILGLMVGWLIIRL
jgi:cell division protein FtsW (lipid II flippase)